MPCSICGNKYTEANGKCGTCNHAERKAERDAIRDSLKKKSTIKRVSQKQKVINTQYSKSLKERYAGKPKQNCAGCGEPATCTAHIIAKSRLKILKLSHLISSPKASFPSCYACNLAIENPKGEAWKSLANIDQCLEFIKIHDSELYQKFIANL